MTSTDMERVFGRPLVEVVGDLIGLPRGIAVLAPEEAFDLLGVGRTRGYDLLQSGEIPGRKLRGRWLISTPALLLWLLSSEDDDNKGGGPLRPAS